MSPRDNDAEVAEREFRDLERTLGRLDDCVEMSDASKEFVEDLCQRVIHQGRSARLTGKETRLLNQLKERYL